MHGRDLQEERKRREMDHLNHSGHDDDRHSRDMGELENYSNDSAAKRRHEVCQLP